MTNSIFHLLSYLLLNVHVLIYRFKMHVSYNQWNCWILFAQKTHSRAKWVEYLINISYKNASRKEKEINTTEMRLALNSLRKLLFSINQMAPIKWNKYKIELQYRTHGVGCLWRNLNFTLAFYIRWQFINDHFVHVNK